MKNKKIGLILTLGMVFALFAGLVLVRQSQETRKGAFYGGITASLWPNPKDVAVGDTFSIHLKVNPKPAGATEAYLVSGVDMVLSFDKSLLELTEAKLDSLFTGPNKVTQANQTGRINLVGVTVSDRDQLHAATFDFVKLTFKAKKKGSTAINRVGEYEIVGSRGQTGDIDRTLKLDSFASTTVNVTDQGRPTPTLVDGQWPILDFKIKLGGTSYMVNDQTIYIDDIPNKAATVVVKKGAFRKEFEDVTVTFDSTAIGSARLSLVGVPAGDKYLVSVTVDGYLPRVFCRDFQVERCRVGDEAISLIIGDNDYDWTGFELEPGDVNFDTVVNSLDFTQVKSALGQTGVGLPEDVVPNGVVNPQDLVKLLETLSNKYGEEI
ncbi:MAG: cohesin domain-containing protein [Patescibacteria group bacterium]